LFVHVLLERRCGGLSLRERGRQHRERSELLSLANSDLKSPLDAAEAKDEERTALSLHRQCSLEQVTVKVLVELDNQALGRPVQASHCSSEPAVTTELLTPTGPVEGATGYSRGRIVKAAAISDARSHGYSFVRWLLSLHLKLALSQVPDAQIPIGKLAQRAGLRPSAVRYYEAVGLLPEPERIAGKRRYDERTLQRLSVIAAGQHAGLSLDEIRELFIADQRGAVSSRLQQLARRKLPEIEDLITRARAVRSWLQAAAECECPSLDQCPLFDARS